jgi:hypothetical protein
MRDWVGCIACLEKVLRRKIISSAANQILGVPIIKQ